MDFMDLRGFDLYFYGFERDFSDSWATILSHGWAGWQHGVWPGLAGKMVAGQLAGREFTWI